MRFMDLLYKLFIWKVNAIPRNNKIEYGFSFQLSKTWPLFMHAWGAKGKFWGQWLLLVWGFNPWTRSFYSLVFYGLIEHPIWKRISRKGVIIAILGLILSFVRAAWIGFAGGLILMAIINPHHKVQTKKSLQSLFDLDMIFRGVHKHLHFYTCEFHFQCLSKAPAPPMAKNSWPAWDSVEM